MSNPYNDSTFDELPEYGKECPICGSDMDWDICDLCGGEGELEVYESDPLWYDPGDTEPCHQCDGAGGWWTCTNWRNHTEEAVHAADIREQDGHNE